MRIPSTTAAMTRMIGQNATIHAAATMTALAMAAAAMAIQPAAMEAKVATMMMPVVISIGRKNAVMIPAMTASGTRLRQALDGAGNIERRRTKARVDVANQRRVAHVRDAAHVGQHVLELDDAKVGHAERAGGYATA